MPGEDVIQEGAAVTFTADTWSKAIKKTEALAAKANDFTLVPIGWFHTHPNFGIFLSEGYDRFIQDTYFDQPGQAAVVFDPIRNQMGIFSSGGIGEKQGSVQRHSGYYLYEEDKTPVEINLSPDKLEQAKNALRKFVFAQDITKENMNIFETVREGEVTDEVLEFVAAQTRKQITELSRLEDPNQRQAALERARHLKDVTAAYKLIKETK